MIVFNVPEFIGKLEEARNKGGSQAAFYFEGEKDDCL